MRVGDDKVGDAAQPKELDPEAEREVLEVVFEGKPVEGCSVSDDNFDFHL